MNQNTKTALIDKSISKLHTSKGLAKCDAHDGIADGVETLLILAKEDSGSFFGFDMSLFKQAVLVLSVMVSSLLVGYAEFKQIEKANQPQQVQIVQPANPQPVQAQPVQQKPAKKGFIF